MKEGELGPHDLLPGRNQKEGACAVPTLEGMRSGRADAAPAAQGVGLAVRPVKAGAAGCGLQQFQGLPVVAQPDADCHAVGLVLLARGFGQGKQLAPHARRGSVRISRKPGPHTLAVGAKPLGEQIVVALSGQLAESHRQLGLALSKRRQALRLALAQPLLLAVQDIQEVSDQVALGFHGRNKRSTHSAYALRELSSALTAGSRRSATAPEFTLKRPSLIASLISSTRAASTTPLLARLVSTACSCEDSSLNWTFSLAGLLERLPPPTRPERGWPAATPLAAVPGVVLMELSIFIAVLSRFMPARG